MTGEFLELAIGIIIWSAVFLCAMFSMFTNINERIEQLEKKVMRNE